jgi:flagellar motor switch protein FliG
MLASLPREEAALLLERLGPNRAAAVAKEMANIDLTTRAQQTNIVSELTTALESVAVVVPVEQVSAPNIRRQLGAVPFSFLEGVDTQSLRALLVEEQPQTIALVCFYLVSRQAADVIAPLPAALQLDVIRRIAALGDVDPEIIRDVERGLMTRVMSQPLEPIDGVSCVRRILAVLDKPLAQSLLQHLAQDDQQLAASLGRSPPASRTSDLKPAGRAAVSTAWPSAPARAA